jgi:hypothetical protein
MKRRHWIILAVIVLITAIGNQFYLATHEAHHGWDKIPLFYSFFGFIGCLIIILAAKGLGKLLLQKKEDYYDVH